MDPKKTAAKIIRGLARFKVVIIWLVILALLGFTLWQTLKISDPGLDESYLNERLEEQRQGFSGIELDEDLQARIDKLETTPVNINPGTLGTNDPFNP